MQNRKCRNGGLSLLEVLIGATLATMVLTGIFYFVTRFAAVTNDHANVSEGEARLDELSRTVKKLWAGRGRESTSNCNCTGANPNCPDVVDGPCRSYQLVTGPVAGCAGLRIFRPVVTVPELRDVVTVCHGSPTPHRRNALPSPPMPACGAGTRPLVAVRSLVAGAPNGISYTPTLEATDVQAASVCVEQRGAVFEVQLTLAIPASRRSHILQRKVILSPRDRSENVEYLNN